MKSMIKWSVIQRYIYPDQVKCVDQIFSSAGMNWKFLIVCQTLAIPVSYFPQGHMAFKRRKAQYLQHFQNFGIDIPCLSQVQN